MDLASIAGGDSISSRVDNNPNAAFRDADFLAIILAEIANQDPFEPTETAKLVENMQKMQELATSRFEDFRSNMRWAQELTGQTVTVGQANLTDQELQSLRERGLNPDVGYGIVEGVATGFRVVGENVWLSVDDKNYPVDNVQKIAPEDPTSGLLEVASNLLGRYVSYSADLSGQPGAGRVTDAQWSADGQLTLSVDGTFVPFDRITSVGT